ncbi:hypothetical protein [Haloarchaeobius amylolyticus]|uniref:hypothetical protein n=1 Tax=Haloarchaeobius amylolyticus TaxID=1198296 RepID=UPI002270AD4D|nr:hypothetical protein [Haloarchaeobius amylolyticus]
MTSYKRRAFLSTLAASSPLLSGCSRERVGGQKAELQDISSSSSQTSFPSAKREVVELERHGHLELNSDTPYFPVSFSTLDREIASECLVLEYEVDVTSASREDIPLDIRMISDYDYESYRTYVKNEKGCLEALDRCKDISDGYQSIDSNQVASSAVDEGVQYKRLLIPKQDFKLIFDASNIWNPEQVGQKYTSLSADVHLRILSDEYARAERRAAENMNNLYKQMLEAAEPKRELHQLAGTICGLSGVGAISTKTTTELSSEASRIANVTNRVMSALSIYDVEIPENLDQMLRSASRWTASYAPILGSLVSVCSNACRVQELNKGNLESEKATTLMESFIISLGFLVADIALLSYGVVARVSSTIVSALDEFLLGYIRKVGGKRLYLLIINGVYALLEQVAPTLKEYLRSKSKRVIEYYSSNAGYWFSDSKIVRWIRQYQLLNEDGIADYMQLDDIVDSPECNQILSEWPHGG